MQRIRQNTTLAAVVLMSVAVAFAGCTGAPSRCTSATTSVSVAGDGTFADDPSISADGRYIAFASGATDLVPGDTNGALDVFVRDTCIGVLSGCAPSTVRASVALDGTQGNKDSFRPVISAGGRFVVFISAEKLGPGSPNSLGGDVYLSRHYVGTHVPLVPA